MRAIHCKKCGILIGYYLILLSEMLCIECGQMELITERSTK